MKIDPDVLEQTRQIDLFSYLRAYEFSNLDKGTTNVYCTAEHDRLKISSGKWYWWSRGFGSYFALDYLIKTFVDVHTNIFEEYLNSDCLMENGWIQQHGDFRKMRFICKCNQLPCLASQKKIKKYFVTI